MATFLEKLRSADESVKTRWVIFFTSVAMAVVIYVWLAYFNTLLSTNDNLPAAAENQGDTLMAVPSSPTIFERMGFAYHAVTSAIGNMLKLQREYTVKPQ